VGSGKDREGGREGGRTHVVGVLDGLRLAALLEVGGEAEPPLGVLDDAAQAAPPAERLLGGVLGLDAPEPLLQVALHPTGPAVLPPPLPTPPAGVRQLQPPAACLLRVLRSSHGLGSGQPAGQAPIRRPRGVCGRRRG
jgi:hypothetical protein